MSTYFDVAGQVRLPTTSWDSLCRRTSGLWLTDDYETAIDVEEFAEGVEVTFDGCFRNLSRYLFWDLLESHRPGITGELVSDCTDGANSRDVLCYLDGRPHVGSSECFNVPVQVKPVQYIGPLASLAETFADPAGLTTLMFLVGDGFHVVAGAGPSVTRTLPTREFCACDGWDDNMEKPVCGNAAVPVAVLSEPSPRLKPGGSPAAPAP